MGLTLLRSCEWEGAWHRFVLASGRGLALLRSCKWEGLGIASFLQVGGAWRCRRLRWLGPRARRVCARRCAWPREWEVEGADVASFWLVKGAWHRFVLASGRGLASLRSCKWEGLGAAASGNEATPNTPTTGAMRSKRRSPRAPLAPPTEGSGSARNLSLARQNNPYATIPFSARRISSSVVTPSSCAALTAFAASVGL